MTFNFLPFVYQHFSNRQKLKMDSLTWLKNLGVKPYFLSSTAFSSGVKSSFTQNITCINRFFAPYIFLSLFSEQFFYQRVYFSKD